MNIKTHNYFTVKSGETTIALFYKKNDGWDIYYTRDGYPLMFVFGLPAVHNIGEAIKIAEANIPQYEDLFN